MLCCDRSVQDRGMEVKSITQKISRYFWPVISIIFLCFYFACNTLHGKTNLSARKIKHQPVEYSTIPRDGSEQSTEHEESKLKLIKYKEDIRDNIVYPEVDISDFPEIDQLQCPDMRRDIEVAPAYSMPLIALASYPRSGNTWSRSLIQIATRYYTGSVHWESEKNLKRVQEWFKAGAEDFMLRKGVCVKTHIFGKEHVSLFEDGAILLLRNPYYSLASEFLRYYDRERNMSMPEIIAFMKEKDDRWTSGFLIQFEKWKNTALSWLTHCKRLMVVYYEDLEENPVRELTRMVAFLGQPIEPMRILCAVKSYSPIKGRGNHTSQMTFDPYTPQMHDTLDEFIAEVNRTLIRKNAVPLPTYGTYYQPT